MAWLDKHYQMRDTKSNIPVQVEEGDLSFSAGDGSDDENATKSPESSLAKVKATVPPSVSTTKKNGRIGASSTKEETETFALKSCREQ